MRLLERTVHRPDEIALHFAQFSRPQAHAGTLPEFCLYFTWAGRAFWEDGTPVPAQDMGPRTLGFMMACIHAENKLAWEDWDMERCLAAKLCPDTADGRRYFDEVRWYRRRHGLEPSWFRLVRWITGH